MHTNDCNIPHVKNANAHTWYSTGFFTCCSLLTDSFSYPRTLEWWYTVPYKYLLHVLIWRFKQSVQYYRVCDVTFSRSIVCEQQESPPAWPQETYRPPRSKYSLTREGCTQVLSWWEGVPQSCPDPGSTPVLSWPGGGWYPNPVLRMRAVTKAVNNQSAKSQSHLNTSCDSFHCSTCPTTHFDEEKLNV